MKILFKPVLIALSLASTAMPAAAETAPQLAFAHAETAEQLIERQAIQDLVDTFSNLADEKRVDEQMPLFTENAQVTTYTGGRLSSDLHGRTEIGNAFRRFLSAFHTVYHLNGQLTVRFTGKNSAEGITYCAVKLVGEQAGRQVLHEHSVRYQDTYLKKDGKWLIAKRVSHFMISETRPLD
ncbi:nuclear transport factor 2 family protein [Uruburuella testudinis]|uniref:Nuclear transport factor 2 family protein n=1 Tax=Uruburuella testudinis TaxID=1282863 RepID=A0ABY4DQK5_9NEIS|nr:nuclear transport factor 2 family protein [Uruburuella testudinis]UOO80902.1 nuclear transport factor 2 family protein [Uruburuella testudinis]